MPPERTNRTRPAPVHPRTASQVEEHTLHAYPNEIRRIIATNQASGRLVAASRPVPGPANDGRMVVQLTLRPAIRTEVAAPAAPRRAEPAPAHRDARPRPIGVTIALVAGAGAAIGTVGYFLIEALADLLSAAASATPFIVGALAVALFLVILVARAGGRGGGGHCPGCSG